MGSIPTPGTNRALAPRREVKKYLYLNGWYGSRRGRTVYWQAAMARSGDTHVAGQESPAMNSSETRISPDPHFEALKSLTRLHWMINFEAVASVPDKIGAIGAYPATRARLN